jgi:hypothetical protein
VDPLRRAYIELMIARAAWRAAKDAEGQVAHWLTCGEAIMSDLLEARERTKMTHAVHQRASRKYAKLSVSSVTSLRRLA